MARATGRSKASDDGNRRIYLTDESGPPLRPRRDLRRARRSERSWHPGEAERHLHVPGPGRGSAALHAARRRARAADPRDRPRRHAALLDRRQPRAARAPAGGRHDRGARPAGTAWGVLGIGASSCRATRTAGSPAAETAGERETARNPGATPTGPRADTPDEGTGAAVPGDARRQRGHRRRVPPADDARQLPSPRDRDPGDGRVVDVLHQVGGCGSHALGAEHGRPDARRALEPSRPGAALPAIGRRRQAGARAAPGTGRGATAAAHGGAARRRPRDRSGCSPAARGSTSARPTTARPR